MSLIDFLKEEREERKKRKKLQKEQKKQKLTREQKKYKIFGIITGCLITFGAIFSCCSSLGGGDYSWNKLVGITDDMIIELEKPVAEKDIIPGKIIGDSDWNSCKQKLLNVGIDIEDESGADPDVLESFYLSDRDLGSMAKQSLEKIGGYNAKIMDFEIYAIGNTYYERSVILINLSNVVLASNLPSVYITTISKIEVLGNNVTCMDYDVKINNIEKNMNDMILDVLKTSSTTDIKTVGNSLVNTTINAFAMTIDAEITLHHGQVYFKV